MYVVCVFISNVCLYAFVCGLVSLCVQNLHVCMSVCVCVCVRACVRACVSFYHYQLRMYKDH